MRYLDQPLADLAQEKSVLVSGPRQVGKTTLAKAWLEPHRGAYLNRDIAPDQERIRNLRLSRAVGVSPRWLSGFLWRKQTADLGHHGRWNPRQPACFQKDPVLGPDPAIVAVVRNIASQRLQLLPRNRCHPLTKLLP